MQHFVRNENIALYKKLIAESENDPSRDEKRHAMLLTLLAEEKAKDMNAKQPLALRMTDPLCCARGASARSCYQPIGTVRLFLQYLMITPPYLRRLQSDPITTHLGNIWRGRPVDSFTIKVARSCKFKIDPLLNSARG